MTVMYWVQAAISVGVFVGGGLACRRLLNRGNRR